MKTLAAVCWEEGQDWSVEEWTLNEPGSGEILVELAFAGMCHSDEHIRQGDLSPPPEMGLPGVCPMIGGHEGSGVVRQVGPDVTRVAEGDHVATSFVPSCGVCPACTDGRQNLCDRGAETMLPPIRHTHADGRVAPAMAGLGTFSQRMVCDQDSVVKVGDWYPLEAVALVSCGVATGWGSAVNVAAVRPGDHVVVIGTGGIGMNAVQGAAMAGAQTVVAVDPVELKREFAQTCGATHSAASIEEAQALVGELTWGRMADAVILTVGDAVGEIFAPAMALVGKGGNLTLTSLSHMFQEDIKLSTFDLAMNEKQLRGTVFGACNPRRDIPALLKMYEAGKLQLDQLVTRRYSLSEINLGYADMHGGRNIRGVIDLSV